MIHCGINVCGRTSLFPVTRKRSQILDAFHFYTKLDQTLLLGLRAKTVDELLTGVRSVADSSIYFHTHRFLHQHHYLSPEPPNDFAYWVTDVLGDDVLGERLWSVDTVRFRNISGLRETLIALLEGHLATAERKIECAANEEFHFMACRAFVFPTRHVARSLNEFAEMLGKVSINSLYFHVFGAKLRLEYGEIDFSRWFRSLGAAELSGATKRLDPYSHTLEGLRQQIIQLVRRHDSH